MSQAVEVEETPRQAFVRGLTRPSPLAIALVLPVALCCLALVCALSSPAFLVRAQDHLLMVDRYDEYGLLTQRMLRAQAAPAPPVQVVLAGSSVLKEAVWSMDELEATLSREAGVDVALRNFTAGDVNVMEYGPIAEGLAPIHGVMVMSVSAVLLGTPPEVSASRATNPRFGFRTRAFDDEIARLGGRPWPRTGIFFLDNLRFLVVRYPFVAMNALLGPPDFAPHMHLGLEPLAGPALDEKIEEEAARAVLVKDNFDANAGILRRAIERVLADGGKVVLLDGTANPAVADRVLAPAPRADYQQRIRAFASDLGVPYWNLNQEAGLTPSDFYDHCHLYKPDPMQRYTAALVRHLVPLLEAR